MKNNLIICEFYENLTYVRKEKVNEKKKHNYWSCCTYRASFQADVANDGALADYEIEWVDDGAQIALIG